MNALFPSTVIPDSRATDAACSMGRKRMATSNTLTLSDSEAAILPFCKKSMRSHMRSISVSWWELSKTVAPRLRCFSMACRKIIMPLGSSPEVGSSRKRKSGPWRSA